MATQHEQQQSPTPGSMAALVDSQASETTAIQLETQTQLSTLPPVSRAPGVALVLGESQPTQPQHGQQWSVPGLGRLGLAPTPTRPATTGDDSQGSANGAGGSAPGSASIASEWKPPTAFPTGSSLESSVQSASRWVNPLDRLPSLTSFNADSLDTCSQAPGQPPRDSLSSDASRARDGSQEGLSQVRYLPSLLKSRACRSHSSSASAAGRTRVSLVVNRARASDSSQSGRDLHSGSL